MENIFADMVNHKFKVAVLVGFHIGLGPGGLVEYDQIPLVLLHGHINGVAAMLDQVAALEWIHGNIASFGGNPDNITILGQSAGAMSIKNLVTSPLSKDMVAKAIIQSGVKEVYYLSDKYATTPSTLASKRMLDAAGVKYIQLRPAIDSITLDFIPEEDKK